MKVVQVMPEFGLAGAETMCENLTLELINAGVEVVVISLYDYHSAITKRLESKNVRVIYLNKKPGLDFSVIFKLVKVFKKEKPDVVHTHRYVMQYAIPAAVLCRVKKRVHTVHNIASKEVTQLAQKLNFIFYHYFHVIPVTLSQEIQMTVHERYRIPLEKIAVIFNGINLDKCIPKTTYECSEKLTYLHIGRFSEQKNHFMLIEAFDIVHKTNVNTRLVLIGAGELEEQIKSKAAELQLDDCVEFLGLKADIYPYLNAADVFVLPSRYEGMPMTLIEAMGTGLPIIATNVGGIPTMIENLVQGICIDVDINAIADAMMRMERKDNREYYGKAALKRAQLFSAHQMSAAYIEIYSK